MASEQLKDLIRRMFDAFERGDYQALEGIMSPAFVEHEDVGPGVPRTREGVIQWLKGMRQAFPDLHFYPEHISVDGDTVWVRGQVSGTHRGDFMGAPASGKSFEVGFLDEIRCDRNQIVEHWGQVDAMGMMQQLGLVQMSRVQR